MLPLEEGGSMGARTRPKNIAISWRFPVPDSCCKCYLRAHKTADNMRGILFGAMMLMMTALTAQSILAYRDKDLGITYAREATTLRVWSPEAERVTVRLYRAGLGGEAFDTQQMAKTHDGGWSLTLKGDQKGVFYTIQVRVGAKDYAEVPDPYTKIVGANGRRGMIADLGAAVPKGWTTDKGPVLAHQTDAILYEIHVRDASVAGNSGISNRGKYLGLIERGTQNPSGLPTGLDHIKALGVTHVHLLPTYDFYTVDETKPDSTQYNWGYDPFNYMTPEGSYSSNPYDGTVRVREFREMVQGFHRAGLGVVLDIVLNHTMFGAQSHLNQTVPNYYYRFKADGSWSNASGCGNETASERPMFREYMLDCLTMWVRDYHVDGFRFDLMGIHDIETMNYLATELRKIRPDLIMYGEGWTSGDSPLPVEKRAVKASAWQLNGIAAFSDDMRDGAKGSVFDAKDRGFVSGKVGMTESIKFGIVAATKHPQVKYANVNYSKSPWAAEPYHCINYVSCHDNHTLWDRLANSNPTDSESDRIKMHTLAESMVLTSQGTPFLLAGTEFLRTKQGVENSFESSDLINEMDWSRLTQYPQVNAYLSGLTAMRRKHPAFRMPTTAMIAQHLVFIEGLPEGIVAYQLNDNANGDKWRQIVVIFNANKAAVSVGIPDGKWKVVAEDGVANQKGIRKLTGNMVSVPPISTSILVR